MSAILVEVGTWDFCPFFVLGETLRKIRDRQVLLVKKPPEAKANVNNPPSRSFRLCSADMCVRVCVCVLT